MAVFHLALRGALHVGEAVSIDRETVLEWLPSDSLFAALVTAWAQTGADVKARLEPFTRGEPPFRISSAFPWVNGIRFFPAPAAFPESATLEGKTAKRVRWLSASVLERLRGGEPVSTDALVHRGTVWITPEESERLRARYSDDDGKIRLWQSFVVPRVTVDRASNTSNLFHAGRVSFAEGDGLWFAGRGAQTDWVREALKVLADTGLGGLRNYGHGAFTLNDGADDLPDSPSADAGMLLSRYAPGDADEIRATLQSDGAAYQLKTVGGWCTDDTGQAWRRRMVRLVAEGALLPNVARARGKLVDVRPDKVSQFTARAVYRYGLPFFIAAGRLEVVV